MAKPSSAPWATRHLYLSSWARSNKILENAKISNIAFLVKGDVFSATTHSDLFLRAKEKCIEIKVFHNNSILTAVGDCGLSLYKFGKVASIPIPEKNFAPESFFDILKENLLIGAHTLFLLDLKPDLNKFLSIKDAIDILLKINLKRKENSFTENTFVIGCARLGTTDSLIKCGKAKDILKINFGEPPYCLIVPANLNHKEEEYLKII